MNHEEFAQLVQDQCAWTKSLKTEMARVLVGQEQLVDRLIIGLLSNGHIILEGVPGLAKTLAINSLAGCLDTGFSRIQFTPDLLPADLLGTMIYNPHEMSFSPKLGPIFSNLILADEINRAPAKVQSALLEAMQERQVTIGDTSYPLPDPFLVMATQNPIDQEGTYQLPEAQLDRFLLKVHVDYPSKQEELIILDRMATSAKAVSTNKVISAEELKECRNTVNDIYIDSAIKEYIVELVHCTRRPGKVDPGLAPLIRSGASPRATINLALAAKANAFMAGRSFVTPQDIKDLAPDVFRHRILLSYEAEAENVTTDEIIQRILKRVIVP
ncbi:MAG: MoxR family ATPase [Rubritalea sp.]|mgnify:CR=1 FL=1|jgi:MoxR-like ATPase|tara:strand:+ start:2082 stop:3065 length:984 start_codon:yes stop_codon:yes gene_type:complete